MPPAILLLFLLLAWVGQAQQQGRQGTSTDLVRPAWVLLGTWGRCSARALPAVGGSGGTGGGARHNNPPSCMACCPLPPYHRPAAAAAMTWITLCRPREGGL